MSLVLLIFALLAFSPQVNCQEIPIGGRSSALGGAVVAQKGDIGCLFWNPATVSSLRSPSLHLSYAGILGSGEEVFMGEVGIGIPIRPIGSSGAVLSWLSGAGYGEGSFSIPVARKFGPVSLGIGIRGRFWNTRPEGEDPYSGSVWGIDIGVQADLGPLSFGVSTINASSTSSTGESISPSISFGISGTSGSTMCEVDIWSNGDNRVLRIGYEYTMSRERDLKMRAGLERPLKGGGGYLSVGIGYVSLGWQIIDLAFLYPFEVGGEAIGYRVSIGFKL